MNLLLSIRPFIDPIDPVFNVHQYWWVLLVPVCFFISMTWKALRAPDLSTYWRQVLIMTGQGVLGIVGLAAGLLIVVRWVLPLIAA
ncbi:MAG: hypothetical protein KGS45_08940 [Planctomycetes bacterium]|nr:hypothetical protein [Planctomycetota bacterium]